MGGYLSYFVLVLRRMGHQYVGIGRTSPPTDSGGVVLGTCIAASL